MTSQEEIIAREERRDNNMMASIKALLDHSIGALAAATTAEREANNARFEKAEGKLASTSAAVDAQTDVIERMARQLEVMVRGIPLTARAGDSQLREIVYKMGSAVGVALGEENVVRVMQIRRENAETSALIVRFGNEGVRQLFMRKFIAKRNMKASEIGFEASNNAIYISENLTRKNAAIKSKALSLKRDGEIYSLRERDGVVVVSTTPENRPKAVHSMAELNNLIHAQSGQTTKSWSARFKAVTEPMDIQTQKSEE